MQITNSGIRILRTKEEEQALNAQKKEAPLEVQFDFSNMESLEPTERIERLKSAFQQTPEEQLDQLSRDYQKLLFSFSRLQDELNGLLEENIQMGEALEKAHEMIVQEKAHNKELSKKMQALLTLQDTGKLSLHARILQMKIAHQDQKEEIKSLREKVQHIGRAPLESHVVNKIIGLRNAGYSYSQIAQSLGISRSSISKYLNQPENRKKLDSYNPNRR